MEKNPGYDYEVFSEKNEGKIWRGQIKFLGMPCGGASEPFSSFEEADSWCIRTIKRL